MGTLESVEGIVEAEIKRTSGFATGSCEGRIFLGTLDSDDRRRDICVKQFYTQSYDDRGNDFKQNPVEKVTESYDMLTFLQERGFKTVPFFGKFTEGDVSLLVMTDLTTYGEVIDEKVFHRGDGLTRIQKSSNSQEVLQTYFRHQLMQNVHGVSLGNGEAHMFTLDKRTNVADIFISDVGTASRETNKYRDTLTQAFDIPFTEIRDTFSELSSDEFPGFDDWKNLYFQYSVASWLGDKNPGITAYNFKSFPEQLFDSGDESDLWFKYGLLESYHMGKSKVNVSGIDISGETSDPLNQAYLLALDRRVRWLKDARVAVTNAGELPRLSDYDRGLNYFDEIVSPTVEKDYWQSGVKLTGISGDTDILVRLRVPRSESFNVGHLVTHTVQPEDFVGVYKVEWDHRDIKVGGPIRTEIPLFSEFDQSKLSFHEYDWEDVKGMFRYDGIRLLDVYEAEPHTFL